MSRWFMTREVDEAVEAIERGIDSVGVEFARGGEEMTKLALAVGRSTQLKRLHLTWNSFTAEDAERLAAAVPASLTLLNLSHSEIGDDGVRALHPKVRKLRTLHLNYVGLGEQGAVALAAALRSSESLRELTLGGNQVDDVGAAALSDLTNLRSLDLHRNRIGDVGAKALATMVERSQCLKVLNLKENLIGSGGAGALAGAVERSESLSELQLGRNRIGCGGARAMAQAVERSLCLQKLVLIRNGILAEGARALARAVERSPCLRWLDVRDNLIGTNGAQALARAARRSRRLEYLGSPYPHLVNPAVEDAKQLRAVLVLLTGALASRTHDRNPARHWVLRDGDGAVLSRVIGFLIES